MTARLAIVPPAIELPAKRIRPPKDYRAWLKAKGFKPLRIERTPKKAGEFEFDHNGKLVPCK